jgi:hypothetical protein
VLSPEPELDIAPGPPDVCARTSAQAKSNNPKLRAAPHSILPPSTLHKIASEARGPSNIFLSPILGIVPALNQGSFEGSEGFDHVSRQT